MVRHDLICYLCQNCKTYSGLPNTRHDLVVGDYMKELLTACWEKKTNYVSGICVTISVLGLTFVGASPRCSATGPSGCHGGSNLWPCLLASSTEMLDGKCLLNSLEVFSITCHINRNVNAACFDNMSWIGGMDHSSTFNMNFIKQLITLLCREM